jgi:hypothetical protein
MQAPSVPLYTQASYRPLVGTTFDLDDGRLAGMPIELVSVTALPGRGECFSLRFRAPGDAGVGQGTYRIRHGELGEFDLFLVPVAPSELEAVVNRLEDGA